MPTLPLRIRTLTDLEEYSDTEDWEQFGTVVAERERKEVRQRHQKDDNASAQYRREKRQRKSGAESWR